MNFSGNIQVDNWGVGYDLCEPCNIENFFVKNCIAKYNWESGFHFESSPTKKNIELINCVSKYNGLDKPSEMYGSGFLGIDKGITCIDCKSIGNRNTGFRLFTGGTIINCYIDGKSITERGITAGSSRNECDIIGNKIIDTTQYGILISGATEDSKISNNTLFNPGAQTGIYINNHSSMNNIISGNVIHMNVNSMYGIVVRGTCIISENTLNNTESNAIRIDGNNCIISYNTIRNFNRIGIYIDASNCIVNGNYFYGGNGNKIFMTT